MELWARVRARLFGSARDDDVPVDDLPGDTSTDQGVRPLTTDDVPSARDDAGNAASETPTAHTPRDADRLTAGATSTDREPVATPPDSAATVAARQERAAEMVLDDERLRGDLADDEFRPLLDWALAATDRLARETVSLDDAAAQETLASRVAEVKALVRLAGEAVAAHVEGATGQRQESLAALAMHVSTAAVQSAISNRARTQIEQLADRLAGEHERTGAEVARALADALTPASEPTRSSENLSEPPGENQP